jgi:hypothetical protein
VFKNCNALTVIKRGDAHFTKLYIAEILQKYNKLKVHLISQSNDERRRGELSWKSKIMSQKTTQLP